MDIWSTPGRGFSTEWSYGEGGNSTKKLKKIYIICLRKGFYNKPCIVKNTIIGLVTAATGGNQ